VEFDAGGSFIERPFVSFAITSIPVSLMMFPFRIFYPMAADQPGNALLMSVKHDAAFELLSVRSGLSDRLPYRCQDGPRPEFSVEGVKREIRELLRRMKGEEGRRIRANFERLSEAYKKTWDEGGEAQVNLEAFLRKYLD
jgi:hypothetical protein